MIASVSNINVNNVSQGTTWQPLEGEDDSKQQRCCIMKAIEVGDHIVGMLAITTLYKLFVNVLKPKCYERNSTN